MIAEDYSTRRFPRTLEEAFGPYQRQGLVEVNQPLEPARIALGAAYALAFAMLLAILFGVIPS